MHDAIQLASVAAVLLLTCSIPVIAAWIGSAVYHKLKS